jgi:hypothetical protein
MAELAENVNDSDLIESNEVVGLAGSGSIDNNASKQNLNK